MQGVGGKCVDKDEFTGADEADGVEQTVQEQKHGPGISQPER